MATLDGVTRLTILDLPVEVLGVVLELSECWTVVRNVSRRFRTACDAGCTHLQLRWSAPAPPQLAAGHGLALLLHKLPSLRDLDGSRNPVDRKAGAFSCQNQQLQQITLPRLRILRLNGSSLLDDLSPLTACTSLEVLQLSVSERVSCLLPLAALSQLTRLRFQDCPAVASLSGLSGCTALQSLKFGGNDHLDDLQPLASLQRLRKISIISSRAVVDLSPLASCTSLEFIFIFQLGLRNLEPLASLPRLEELVIQQCTSLSSLYPLQGAMALKRLYVAYCPISDTLPACSSLESIILSHVTGVLELTVLASCARLTTLNLVIAPHSGLSGYAELQAALPLLRIRVVRCR